YPYDGSAREKKEWLLSSSYFDLYVLDNLYPRTNGYISLGLGWDENSNVTYNSHHYNSSSSPEYISIRQQMNSGSYFHNNGMTDLSVGFSGSNLYDMDNSRESNLKFDLDD